MPLRIPRPAVCPVPVQACRQHEKVRKRRVGGGLERGTQIRLDVQLPPDEGGNHDEGGNQSQIRLVVQLMKEAIMMREAIMSSISSRSHSKLLTPPPSYGWQLAMPISPRSYTYLWGSGRASW